MTRLRAVIDTNVFIAALIKPGGTTAKAVEKATSEFTVIRSADTISELEQKLATAKLQKYVQPEEVKVFLDALRNDTVLIDAVVSVRASRDPKDDKFIALAATGGADFFITEDKDLLVLEVYEATQIVTPLQFLALGEAPR